MPIKPSEVFTEDVQLRASNFCNYVDEKLKDGDFLTHGDGYVVQFTNNLSDLVQDEVGRRYVAVDWKAVRFVMNIGDYNSIVLTP